MNTETVRKLVKCYRNLNFSEKDDFTSNKPKDYKTVVYHYILAMEGSEAGLEYNIPTFQLLRNRI